MLGSFAMRQPASGEGDEFLSFHRLDQAVDDFAKGDDRRSEIIGDRDLVPA
jgi:hypothetical protein